MRSRTRKPDETPILQADSDSVGRFWFERSRAIIAEGKTSHRGILSREKQQLEELERSSFFDDVRLRESVVKFNDESSEAPRLRALDWAVTNYAKGHPLIMIVKDEHGADSAVDPNLSYEGELRRHHRLLFDPFRRGTHIFFDLDGMVHRTTVGQLTFVRWCVLNGVDKYVEENLQSIRDHMSAATRKATPSPESCDAKSGEKRRRELTKAPTRRVRGAVSTTFQILSDPPCEK